MGYLEADPKAAKRRCDISLTFQCFTLKIHTNGDVYAISYPHLFYYQVMV